VAAWFRDHDGNVRAWLFLLTLSAPLFAAFAALPRWLGAIAAVALVEQLIETVTIFGSHGFIAPGGPMNIYLGAGLTAVALLSLGIALARSPMRPRAAA